jgi:uncharacterized protein (TIGR03086 family)
MSGRPARDAGGVGLLRRAIGYTLRGIESVTPDQLARPTPCRGWDLRMLLRHACESVAALHEGLHDGRIGLYPPPDDEAAADPAPVLQARTVRLLDDWTARGRDSRVIAVADCPLADTVLAQAAALEIAVHGWDISQACGHDLPIPDDLARDLLQVSVLLVPAANRHSLFAAPIPVGPAAGPGERLLAYLGRFTGERDARIVTHGDSLPKLGE